MISSCATRASVSLFVIASASLSPPLAALAQSPSKFDVEGGMGFAVGGGADDSAPSLPTFAVGIVAWPTERWGVAISHIRSIGEDVMETLDPPSDTGNRAFVGQKDLQYTTMSARYRRRIEDVGNVILGVGVVVGGSFADIVFLQTAQGRDEQVVTTSWKAVSLEFQFQRALTRRFSISGGVALALSAETSVLHPVALGVFSF